MPLYYNEALVPGFACRFAPAGQNSYFNEIIIGLCTGTGKCREKLNYKYEQVFLAFLKISTLINISNRITSVGYKARIVQQL